MEGKALQSARRAGNAQVQATLLPRSGHDIPCIGDREVRMTPVRRACVLWAALTMVPGLLDAQPIKLRVTLQVPVTSHIGANLKQFKGEVEKGTENAISIEIFDRGQLYIDERVIDAVSSGE